MKRLKSRSQAWYADFTLAIFIFTFLLIIYFSYTSNLSNEDSDVLKDLTNDIKSISSSLVVKGYPVNWTESNVQRLGLTDNTQRINQDKLIQFINLNYDDRKSLFNTQYDYFIFFKNNNGCLVNISDNFGIGHSDVDINELEDTDCNGFTEDSIDISDINPKNLVRTDRLLIYNSEIVDMVIYLWQK